MAETVAKRLLETAWPGRILRLDSCGTAGFNAGKPADPRTVAALLAEGYAPGPHVARQITDEDFRVFQQIVAMDRSNLQTLRGWAPPTFSGTIRLLPATTGDPGIEVPDPFYGDAGQFPLVLRVIERGVSSLLKELMGRPV